MSLFCARSAASGGGGGGSVSRSAGSGAEVSSSSGGGGRGGDIGGCGAVRCRFVGGIDASDIVWIADQRVEQ